MSSTTYQVSRGWVRLARWSGYLLALFAIAYVGGYLYAPEEIPLGLAAIGATFFGGLASISIRIGHAPEVYSIEISSDGVRRTSSGAWVPWAGVIGLRERPILNRIDLIGPGGPTGITLEYQLEAFQEALDQVLGRVRIEVPHPSRPFRRPLVSWSQLIVLGIALSLSALGAWVWVDERGWVGPLLIALILGALIHDSFSQISQVSISGGFVTLRRGFRTIHHALSDITSAKLALRPIGNANQYLDVFIEVEGKSTAIRPAGTDPFELFKALEAALNGRTDPLQESGY